MDYAEASNFLFGLRRFGQRPGTESAEDLCVEVGDPRADLACVQVAGSNGKGSTARMTECVLREAGLSVGLFTSPHLEDVRERIQVDGRKIPESAICEFVERAREGIVERGAEGTSPTFFEATTVMALWYFAREDVDVAVLEVGIGGRLDATSVVDPIASAVTTVSLEHTSLLGDSVEEIARDKAHVAPPDRPLVTAAEDDALAAIRSVAGDVQTVGLASDEADTDVLARYGGRVNHTEAAVELEGSDWRADTRLPVLGAHQAENAGVAAALARQVADALDVDLDRPALERGLRQAHWPGRFEVLSKDPLVVLDGAHNAGACRRLATVLDEFDYDDLLVGFGAMHDKPHGAMVDALPQADLVRTCQPDLERAEDPAVLAEAFEVGEGADAVEVGGSVQETVRVLRRRADPDDCVLVTGSLFTVAEARAVWTRLLRARRIDDREDAATVLATDGVRPADAVRFESSAVHRTVETRLQRRQARVLAEELRSIGGDCAVSRLDHDGEFHRVVLTGTRSQFRTLADVLQDRPYGLAGVGRELNRQFGDEGPRDQGNGDAKSDGPGSRADATDRHPWGDGTAVMGILNVTPDSFHDGGEYDRLEDALERAEAMVEAGVDVIDVGGESTRPGAEPVPVEEERERVVPVIEALADLDVAVSVDTRKAAVAEPAVEAGADLINDVSGLADPEMRFVAAERDAALVVMHSLETPVNPDRNPTYDDVVRDVLSELRERVLLAEKAGLDRERIVVDPGLGFGKSAAQSFELLDRLDEFDALGCPVMVGHSHKSMFDLAGYDHGDRLEPTVAATALAAERGANLVRVHDVPENLAAVRVVEAAEGAWRR